MLRDRADPQRNEPGGNELRGPGEAASNRIDRFEAGVLAAFTLVSVWVLALDLWQVVVHARIWTGTDGFYLVDQMQYLAWIRDASRHVAASNLFVLGATPADYFQPAVALSGGLSAFGVAPWLALLLWKPVAVGGAFFAVREYGRRSLDGRAARRVALVLALFFGSFTVIYGSLGVVGDLFPGFLTWGYPFGLIATAVMVLALLAYERGRTANRFAWAPPLLGLLAASLHPWQGELLIFTVVGAELMNWRDRERVRRGLPLIVATLGMTAVPLVYYAVLGQVDSSWQLARDASKHSFSLWTILIAIAPLAIPAALAYRERPPSFLGAITRAWPLAALVVFLLSATELSATPLHAFEGITIPLAVLAVEGLQRVGWHWMRSKRALAWAMVAAVTVPSTVYELTSARGLVAPSAGNANFITDDERAALAYLDHDPEPGEVVSRFYLGAVVPAKTGRHTFVGDCLWSEPQCTPRAKITQRLFEGSLKPVEARAFVLWSGARFLLADCESTANITRLLAPIVLSVHRFGCAAVYTVD